MKTYKLPIYVESTNDEDYIHDLCRQQSIITRSAYNDISKRSKSVKIIEQEYKIKNNIPYLDSWFIRCGILKGKQLSKNEKVVFGGKNNFIKLLKGKLTKEEWKNKRIYPIEIQGEKHQGGNRKCSLHVDDDFILFKPNKNKHIKLILPKIRKKWKEELQYIQDHKHCFTIRLTKNNIEIMVDENLFSQNLYNSKEGRILGIDINPDFIGYSIVDYPNQNIITKKCIDISELNKKSGLASDHPKSKYLTNKRKHEIIHIVKSIIKECEYYKVEKIVVEDLNIKAKNYGNKNVNRKNNYWLRNLLINKIKMECNINKINLIEINPAYSSFVGNMIHDYFDPISASIEIGRRGYYKFVKGKFYPSMKLVKHQWKEMVTNNIQTWKELYLKSKTLEIRYRVSLDIHQVSCRISHRKKRINLYTFI